MAVKICRALKVRPKPLRNLDAQRQPFHHLTNLHNGCALRLRRKIGRDRGGTLNKQLRRRVILPVFLIDGCRIGETIDLNEVAIRPEKPNARAR